MRITLLMVLFLTRKTTEKISGTSLQGITEDPLDPTKQATQTNHNHNLHATQHKTTNNHNHVKVINT
jgi:hypothetical protein